MYKRRYARVEDMYTLQKRKRTRALVTIHTCIHYRYVCVTDMYALQIRSPTRACDYASAFERASKRASERTLNLFPDAYGDGPLDPKPSTLNPKPVSRCIQRRTTTRHSHTATHLHVTKKKGEGGTGEGRGGGQKRGHRGRQKRKEGRETHDTARRTE